MTRGDLEDEKIGEAIAVYLEAAEAGRPLSKTEFIARYPDLAAELESFLGNHADTERLTRPLRELTGTEPRRGKGFGDYEILGEIARGGMGVVYRARQKGLQREVALKMIRAGRLATREDIDRFKGEAKSAASLSHPYIVPIHEFGEHEGQLFFTMELIQGRTLDQHKADTVADPSKAARVMALIARAVHHAHQRRIIHRDLKPSNILIDAAGKPHITDFGLAVEKGKVGLTEPTVVLGTLPYVAPERLGAEVGPMTTSVDLWSLGVILYELITGMTPFLGKSDMGTVENVRKEDPLPPRQLNPNVSRDLEAICLKCLEKEPEQRYGSAIGLARDLERCLKSEPIDARPVHKIVRAWSWCRRNPAGAGLALGGAVLLVALTLGLGIGIARKRAADDEKLKGLVHMARFASYAMLNRMQEWGLRVESIAQSPELLGLLKDWNRSVKERPSSDPEDLKARPEAKRLQAFLDRLPRERMVVNWQIMDTLGVMMARQPAAIIGTDFRERDYFKGTKAHAGRSGLEGVHVSSVYRSQADGLDKFDLCAPVLESGTVIGIVAVSVTTDPTLGVRGIHDEQRKVVLVAPWDPSPPNNRRQEGPPEFVLLLHPAMTPGQEAPAFDKALFPVRFARDCRQELSITDNFPVPVLGVRDYVDAFGARDARYGGTWFAGFAPVGNTGFVVIVQQRDE